MSRALKLAGSEGPRGAGDVGEVGEVSAWLEVVVRLCGLPEGERGQLRDELRDHIEGRVRDLLLTGRGEAEATAEAIGELGDAAELARNLNTARRRPQRRRLMATMMGAAALAVIGVGVVAVWQPSGHPVPVSAYSPEQGPEAVALSKAKVTLRGESDWDDLFKLAGEASHSPVTVHWAALKSAGGGDETSIRPDRKLDIEVDSLSLPATLELLNDRLDLNGSQRVEWRVVEGTLFFATRGYFDKSEMVLKTYDVSSLPGMAEGGEEAVERAEELIRKTAEPDAWEASGGSSTMAAYGTKLFVKAPPRVHAGVEWVLGELREKEGHAAAGESVRVYALKRTDAQGAAEVVRKLLKEEWAGVRASAVTADARTNSLVVKGTPEVLKLVEGCLGLLDTGTGNPAANQTRAFPMQRASVGQAMEAVKPMITSRELRGQIESAATDVETNSLVVVGTAAALDAVQKRLAQLDAEAAQAEKGVGKGGGAPGGAVQDNVKGGGAPGGAVQDNVKGAGGVPAAVLENIGPGEVVQVLHGEPSELAAVVARRLVEWSREVGGERFVVTRKGDGVLVAGTPGARSRALAMLRELDEAVGRAGREAAGGGEFGAASTMAGLRRTSVPMLSDLPILNRMFTNEEPTALVIRAEGGLIRVTGPDGTSVETAEIRVAPSPK